METKVVQTERPPAAPAEAAAIQTRSLTKRFAGVEALHDLDLSVPRNSIFGFLGPNGAGKTTTIKLLLGLARPTAGVVRVFGMDSARESLAVRRRIGYLAQEPHYYNHLTARQTLEFTARFFYRGRSSALAARIEESLELVGLSDRADRAIRGFSGGERQRLGLAQAQINNPDLLILDEPAASLDPVGRRDVLDVMRRLKQHATIFYSTHILDDVQRVSDQVAILDRGRLVASAPTGELIDDGGGGYSVTVRGDGAAAVAALRAMPWATSVSSQAAGQTSTLDVRVSDQAAAESGLLAAVLATGTTVTAYGRVTRDLEDVFIRLVEGRA